MGRYSVLWIVKVICTICLFGTAFTTILCGFANSSQAEMNTSRQISSEGQAGALDTDSTDINGSAVSSGHRKDFRTADTDITHEAADRLSQDEYGLHYISVTVTADDTLWSIASRYRTEGIGSIQEYISQIKHCNNMTSDSIYAGSHLVVPVFGL